MASLNLRVPSGLIPLTNQQVDDNFQNLNNALGAAGSTTIPTPTGTGSPVLSASPTITGTLTTANLTYTGTLTGSTGIMNIGSGQLYKDALGNLGLGTSSPASKLEIFASAATPYLRVNDGTYFHNIGVSTAGGSAFYNTGTYYQWLIAGAEKMRIDPSGNVGIGTSSPLSVANQTSLNINGTNASRYELLVGGARKAYFYSDASAMQIGTLANIPIQIFANSAEVMRIDSTGNVGIGTANPIQLLTVESTSNVRATIRNSTENTSYSSSLDFATGTGSLSSLNVVSRVIGVITQADPSALQGALVFHTNSGDTVTEKMRIDASGNVAIGATSAAVKLVINSTDAILLPKGTTANRPTGVSGYVRFNTELVQFEGHNGTAWGAIGAGATGGTGNYVFFENDIAITASYTISTNKNAMTAGPVTVNDGVSVTVPAGSSWTIV